MNPDLASYLASAKKLAEGEANWGGNMPLRITTYLSPTTPPLPYVSSVRAIVFKGNSVLVIEDKKHELYILPGGRTEKGESPEETLRRELLEETGWKLRNLHAFACMHFHHLAPKPPNYAYPHPDFLWPVYIAEAATHHPSSIQDDDYVLTSRFYSIKDTLEMAIDPGQLELLKAAVQLRPK